MAVDHMLEELMGMLGDFGRYQAFQFILHLLAAVTAGLHMLSLVTVSAVPEHRCFIEGIDSLNSTTFGLDALGEYIPLNKDGALDSCRMFQQGTAANATISCSSYVFDTTYYKSSRAIEWDLVCDRRWMGSLAQTIYMLGVFTGAVWLGGLADKIGRKKVFCWSALLQLILGVGVAFTPEYYSFLVIRYLYGIFGSAGSYITGFVLTMELVGPSKRTPCGISFQAAFAGGIMLVAAWGALIPDRMLLQVVYGLHGLLLVAHWWIMDESPRWLWMQDRKREAIDIIAKAVRMNGRGLNVDKEYYLSKDKSNYAVEATPKTSAGLSDLFKTPNLRKMTLNVCLCWFANSITYYGLSLSSGKLGGNPYLILFLMALVEMPSYLAIILLLDKLGRRSITSTLMIVGGICCIVAAYLNRGSTESTTVVMFGKLFIAGSFAVIYNYSAELFPTVVRNSAMGLGSMCARLAGASTPMIILFDSFDPKIPAVIFGVMSLISGSWVLFLPETMGKPMPQSLQDGENFGKGDTAFSSCMGRNKTYTEGTPLAQPMVQMQTIER
ncbi:organic cation transporter protein [Toxorhynchites rutilus septentrionalis]|uniref:organic cation transporter protein n=1 Tax=Toxorhynchites rutilus septentrionalis TaxID=329112 RepID=UPI0024783B2F|nr:organic cation transporter protein [Toxorhynchites rutilus septentrionalis]